MLVCTLKKMVHTNTCWEGEALQCSLSTDILKSNIVLIYFSTLFCIIAQCLELSRKSQVLYQQQLL